MSQPDLPFIVFESVSTAPEKGQPAVTDVSLGVRQGEALALVGPNGSGKTTILRLIAAMITPVAGRILVAGRDTATFGYEELRAHRTRVGLVFEAGSLLANRSIRDNIALPFEYHEGAAYADDEIEARVQALAQELGIEEGLDAIGAGINTSLARAALFARALIMEPAILLVDEPQLALSPRQRSRVSEALQRRRKDRGLTILFADHDGALSPFVADRRLYVVRGQVSERSASLGDDAAFLDEAARPQPPGGAP